MQTQRLIRKPDKSSNQMKIVNLSFNDFTDAQSGLPFFGHNMISGQLNNHITCISYKLV